MQTKRVRGRPGAGKNSLLRQLPAVARVMGSRPFKGLVRDYGKQLVTGLLRDRLGELRAEFGAGRGSATGLAGQVTVTALAREVRRSAQRLIAPSPRPVINATGIVVHTNLGRSPLSPEAARRVAETAGRYVDLEYDLAAGGRGSRGQHLRPLVERLFPGSGFVAVNNNAAAIMLCLHALARGKEVPVSRGELVEIGGSFRVPEIMAASGARLVEVGTTNRTRAGDYRKAVSKRTGALLKVHTSNFRIVGFSEEASVADLAAVAQDAGLPLIVDWGSGDLVDLEALGIRDEKPVHRILEEGADLVTFSGDKLLGGPQAGLVVGRPELIRKLRIDPFARICRLDRLMIAALRETLGAYVRGVELEEIPTLRMLSLSARQIGSRASKVVKAVRGAARDGGGWSIDLVSGVSRSGGGSSPVGERPTRLIAISGREGRGDEVTLERKLRLGGSPPVIGRIQEGRVLLDLRTVMPDQDPVLIERLSAALAG